MNILLPLNCSYPQGYKPHSLPHGWVRHLIQYQCWDWGPLCGLFFESFRYWYWAPVFTQGDLNLLFDLNCSENQTKFLAPFSNQEIRDVFFSLPRNKTSGLLQSSSQPAGTLLVLKLPKQSKNSLNHASCWSSGTQLPLFLFPRSLMLHQLPTFALFHAWTQFTKLFQSW